MVTTLYVLDFSRPLSFAEALAYQLQRVHALQEKRGPEAFLLLLEHEPVITLGRKFRSPSLFLTATELQKKGIALCETDRGGEATYHGPGQLVGYLIMNLNTFQLSLKRFIFNLEESMIQTVEFLGVDGATRREGYPGVWIHKNRDRNLPPPPFFCQGQAYDLWSKIGFVGIHVSRWITYHGFSLNVDLELAPFTYMRPCGITDCRITSLALERESKPSPSMEAVKRQIKSILPSLFHVDEVREMDKDSFKADVPWVSFPRPLLSFPRRRESSVLN